MKKKINILLLIAVLGLWGSVLYRLVKNYMVANENSKLVEQRTASIPVTKLKKKSFEFKPLNRDPFLGRVYSSNTIEKKHKIVNKVVGEPKIKSDVSNFDRVVSFPNIQYYGVIQSSQSNKEVILIKINGQLVRLSKNGESGGLKIKQVYKDSVVVTYSKQTRVIKRG